MEVKKYINQKKDLYFLLFKFIENKSDATNDFQILISALKKQKIDENKDELIEFLYLLLKISSNFQRKNCLYDKIEEILLHFESEIKHTFSNSELFDIFKNEKKILLFLFEKEFITMHPSFLADLLDPKFSCFFYPQIKTLLNDEKREKIKKIFSEMSENIFINFEKKRHIGENESDICYFIHDFYAYKFIF